MGSVYTCDDTRTESGGRMKDDRDKRESELREELEFHLEQETEERAAAGLSLGEARYAARRDLGNLTLVMENTRAAWGASFLDSLQRDIRFSARWLYTNSGFTLLAVLILGIGIGATTAVFSVVNAVLLKPLVYRDSNRIVVLSTLWKKFGPGGNVSIPDFHDWHDGNTSFEAMAYYSGGDTAVTAGSTAEFATVANVTSEFFKVFKVEPVAGRTFSTDESRAGASGAVLISYSFAQNHYRSFTDALGSTVTLGGRVLPVVGILPPGFQFPGKTDIWFPAGTIVPETPFSRSGHNVQVIAKLKSGVSTTSAQAEMTAIGDRLEKQYPDSNAEKNVAVTALHDTMVKDTRLMLYLLLGTAGLVLLVACGNVANLLLAKAAARSREIAVRTAIGAGRGRIVQQLCTESLLLGLIAGIIALFISNFGSQILIALAPGNVPRLFETKTDGWVLLFNFTVSLVSCLIFGLVPALSAIRVDLNSALKEGSTRHISGGRDRLRRSLVIVEIAFSVVLLITATLLIRSFSALQNVALGFQPENVLIMETSMPGGIPPQKATGIYKTLLSELATTTGVSAVGAVRVPPGRVTSSGAYLIDSVDLTQMRVTLPQAVYSVVTPGAFAALGIPVIAGRDFSSEDMFDAPFTVVINQELAKRAFPGQNPLGHTILTGFDSLKPMTIVGVVTDIRQRGPAAEPDAEIYMPYEQHPGPSTALRIVARTKIPPEHVFETFRSATRKVAPEMPVKFTTMETRLSENVAAPRFRSLLVGSFAALAVVLAMAGIYAVVSFLVNQRTNEIGLRVALGAASGDVQRMVLSEGIRMAAVGLVLGMAGAVAAGRFISTLLFNVKSTDVVTYVSAIAIVTLVTLVASYFPARRAARIDPSVALRQE
jgi:putative ABC transport system permease protein